MEYGLVKADIVAGDRLDGVERRWQSKRGPVMYKNCRNDTRTATWNPPEYAAEGRVLVRPNITVNGTAVEIDRTYPVLRTPSVELVDRVLRLSDKGIILDMKICG